MAKALWTCTALAACLVILSGSVAEAIDRSRSRATAAGSPKRKKGKVVGLNGTSHVFERALPSVVSCCAALCFVVCSRLNPPTHLHNRAARSVGHATRESVKLKTADFDFLRPTPLCVCYGDLRVAVFRQGSVNARLAGALTCISPCQRRDRLFTHCTVCRPHTSITRVQRAIC
jgi:hypothetical protein